MSRASFADAATALARRDPAMARVIRAAGPCTLGGRPRTTHFESLLHSIVFQQLAGKAAAAIHGRVVALFDGKPTPEGVLATPEASLRAAGLSVAKVASIRDLALKASDGSVPLRSLGRLPDDQIVARLSVVRGIGRWTAEMFLIFQLGRTDVWPVDDLGVRNGHALVYGMSNSLTPKELQAEGERYRPHRTVAAWYCWRAVHLSRGEG